MQWPRVHIAEHGVRLPLDGTEDRSFDQNPQRSIAGSVENGVAQWLHAEAERRDSGG